MLASPFRAVSVACSFGFLLRLWAPNRRSFRFGLKPRPSQPVAVTGLETGTAEKAAGLLGSAPPPKIDPVVAIGAQLVPLRVNSFALRLIATDLMSSLTPPKTSGIALVLVVI